MAVTAISVEKMKSFWHSQVHDQAKWDLNIGDTSSQDDSGSEEMVDVDSDFEHSNDESSDDIEGDQEDSSGEEEDGDEDEDVNNVEQKDVEIEELEKELSNIRNQEQDILRNLRSNNDEDVLKGQAVKNQKAMWDKTLELRFLLQKAFVNTNRLPKDPIKSLFCNTDSKVDEAYLDLISSSSKTLDSLLELQEAILEKNPSITQEVSNGNSGQTLKHIEGSGSSSGGEDEEWPHISEMQSRIASFRNRSVDKWQRKTQVTTGVAAFKGKLQAFNQNISEQVAAYMRDPTRMVKGMQQSRSTVAIFGSVPDVEDNKKEQDLKVDGDPELLDDSDFYQQLLKEFFETVDPTASETTLYALKRLQTKKRKIVDRRASKSRKIRYNVHEKIVNFMAPQSMNIPPMADKLFENLFGLKTQKPLSVE